MAAQRPAVLVFQEFASLSFGAATPELNCLIAGPSFWIKDFPDERAKPDKGADIKLATNYGTKNLPATGTTVQPVGAGVVVVAEPPSNQLGALLEAASVRVFLGAPRVELAHGAAGVAVVTPTPSPTISTGAVDMVVAGVQAGDWAILTQSGNTLIRKVRSITQFGLTFTDDITSPFVNTTPFAFRVERDLSDSLVDSSFVTVSGNAISIAGAITLLVGGVAKPVSFGEVFVGYRSLRQDLAEVKTLKSVTEIVGQLGLIDARNPLAVGMFTALTNSSASIQAFGVQANTLVGYTAMKASLANRKDIYAVIPLIQDVSVIAMLKSEFENLASPEYAVLNGVSQKFRMVVGAPTALPTSKIVIDTQVDGKVEQNGTAPAAIRTFTFPTLVDFVTAGARPGDTLVVAADDAVTPRNGTYTITHVNSATSVEVVNQGNSPTNDIPGVAQAVSTTTTVTVTRGATSVIPTTAAIANVVSATLDALFLDLFDANGTFIDAGILPGDFLELPTDPDSPTTFTTSVKLVIATIVSNQRVRIVNNGSNTALVNTELPHGVSRVAPISPIATTATLTYRVTRALDKTGQVTELISVAQSLKSRRAVIVWPDLVDVAGLTDGSLPRAVASVHAPATSQPGFFLACAVGGLLASLPSHQGITNMGIAGISKIYNANTYFDDRQMTQISNGGWLLFQQDTPSALPYIIHQLTTDPSTLEFGEISLVKNFDFVSLFFSDILDDFLGIWNINPETLQFIRAAIDAGIENLKLRRKVRIGAPILSGRITSLAESTSSADRIEAYVEIDFPKPLNTIGLHLISI